MSAAADFFVGTNASSSEQNGIANQDQVNSANTFENKIKKIAEIFFKEKIIQEEIAEKEK